MRRLLGLRDLVHDAVDSIASLVEQTQHASFERSVAALSQVPGVGDAVHTADGVRRAVSGAVFGAIAGTNRTLRRVGDELVTGVQAAAEVALGDARTAELMHSISPAGPVWVDVAQGALNAALGDFLSARGNALATELGFMQDGARLELTREGLERALPEPNDRLCIFVHGLGCTEHTWWLGAREYHGDPAVSFGTLLRRDHGYSCLYVRYNSGRHVSENARELARQLAILTQAYPRRLRELVLVGHSMGGLVVRGAAHYGQLQDLPWVPLLTHVLCIGSPHTGSFLEKSAHVAAALLNAVPAAGTQVPATILNARSAGIKDLRFGYVLDEDWTQQDPDALLSDNRHDVPLVPTATYGFLASTFLRDPAHRMGELLGDLLVRVPSASGKAAASVRDIPFHIGSVLPGLHHAALLNHPDVYHQLVEFLKLRRPDTTGD